MYCSWLRIDCRPNYKRLPRIVGSFSVFYLPAVFQLPTLIAPSKWRYSPSSRMISLIFVLSRTETVLFADQRVKRIPSNR